MSTNNKRNWKWISCMLDGRVFHVYIMCVYLVFQNQKIKITMCESVSVNWIYLRNLLSIQGGSVNIHAHKRSYSKEHWEWHKQSNSLFESIPNRECERIVWMFPLMMILNKKMSINLADQCLFHCIPCDLWFLGSVIMVPLFFFWLYFCVVASMFGMTPNYFQKKT